MSRLAAAATSGLCTLIATVFPPHFAAAVFPIAASRAAPRLIFALYTWPIDADATARFEFWNSKRDNMGSFCVIFSSLDNFLFPSFRLGVGFNAVKSPNSCFIIFMASISLKLPTSSTSFPSSVAQIVFFNRSGLRDNAWPDLIKATDPEDASACRSCAPRARCSESECLLNTSSWRRPRYQPSRGRLSLFSLHPTTSGRLS
mmetsp:Transcript_9101/g.13775  ORF Transcript_9101/g.13775 Transcript_9101/m.13775 type:complete len:202 (-) Transcript_9101:588-1193(-)